MSGFLSWHRPGSSETARWTGRIDRCPAIPSARQKGSATQEIARNVAEAATGTGAVTGTVATLAEAAGETGAAAAQVVGAASEMPRRSEHLSVEVARFRATVRAA